MAMQPKFAKMGGGSVQLFGKGGAKSSGFVNLAGLRVKTTRGVKKAIKGALTMAAHYWQAFYLPLHFKPVAKRRYPGNVYKAAYNNPKNPKYGATTVIRSKAGKLSAWSTSEVNFDRGDPSRFQGSYRTRKSAWQKIRGFRQDNSPAVFSGATRDAMTNPGMYKVLGTSKGVRGSFTGPVNWQALSVTRFGTTIGKGLVFANPQEVGTLRKKTETEWLPPKLRVVPESV